MKKKSAREKTMDYLAMRDHSRDELLKKLKKHDYTPEEIQIALDSVEESGWLLSGEALAEKVSESLHRKKKSHLYIVQYLKAKGLPPVARDSEREYDKAQILLKSHFSKLSKSSDTDTKQVIRFLKNRGFDGETIAKICKRKND
ncbi:MAG: regulatory protein RecX [Bdellovibrionaceae bacterium]|nr:regulatory protein RecX [Pseudobdellovibrionaceae bacterium]